MFRNGDGRVLRDVACDFLCTFLHDEAAEAAEIHVVLVGQRRLDAIHESLNDCLTHNILIFGRVLPDICYRTVSVAGRGLREK